MAMTIMGSKTSRAVIQKSESHKLHHAFPLKDAQRKPIYQGNLVVLETDGTVRPFASGDTMDKVIGVAVTDSKHPAYAESKQCDLEVTVAMKGYMIVFGASTAGSLNAGPVKPDGDRFGIYDKYVTAAVDANNPPVAINLTKVSSANALIQVLIL